MHLSKNTLKKLGFKFEPKITPDNLDKDFNYQIASIITKKAEIEVITEYNKDKVSNQYMNLELNDCTGLKVDLELIHKLKEL